MPYKIVQTCEDGEQCLSIVPSAWEKDNVLWWPKATSVAKLLRDEYSHPTSKWQLMQCIKKRDCRTRVEAESELENMEARSDTEVEDKIIAPAKKLRRSAPNTNISKQEPKNFNEFITLPDTIEPPDEDIVEDMPVTVQLTEENFQNIVFIPQIDPVYEDALTEGQCVQENFREPASIEMIAANQSHIIEKLTKIIATLAQLKVSLDYLNERVLNIEITARDNMPAVQLDECLMPVDSLQMLNDLEQTLKDQAIMTRYVSTMSHICGSGGREDGIDCCYRLIDNFITRQFLTTCTWTGMSRDNHTEQNGELDAHMKVPFMMYKNIRHLFLKLILLADNSFTAIKCDAFFKRVLKNSKQRLLSKTVSKHKNRPKNLKYNARQEKDGPVVY